MSAGGGVGDDSPAPSQVSSVSAITCHLWNTYTFVAGEQHGVAGMPSDVFREMTHYNTDSQLAPAHQAALIRQAVGDAVCSAKAQLPTEFIGDHERALMATSNGSAADWIEIICRAGNDSKNAQAFLSTCLEKSKADTNYDWIDDVVAGFTHIALSKSAQ